MLKLFLKAVAWVGSKAHAKLVKIKEREALANALTPGTLVTLSKCRCPYDHAGVWRIDEYILDASDYRIVRVEDEKCDYARRDVMEVIR